ncbi:putative reverse transcriptase domain-containing protein [Tanacetum coccineum]
MHAQRVDRQGGNVRGQAYVVRDAEHNQGPNVVTGTFLLNNRYVTILFDSGADKSFVDVRFSHLLDIKPAKLNTSYEVELADGKVVCTNTVLKGCTLNLLDHLFDIDLMPIELGTFDVIIGMDWLVERDAVIVCGKKEVHVPYKNKTLVVKGDSGAPIKAQVTEKEPSKKQLQDVPVIRNFPEVFPDDLPGLPPPRQVEFRIELCPEAAPVQRVLAYTQRSICGLVITNSELEKKISPLQLFRLAILPFLSSADDTTDSDTSDTPPSRTHGTPFTEIISSTQRSPVIPHRRVIILAPGQPIPHGRPYRYHLNKPVHMMIARKKVGLLHVQQLAVRHYVNHSSSDSSSDFHSDASSNSSSRYSLSDHSSPDLPSTSAGPSRKRRRSPMASIPELPPVSGALSPVRADLISSPKRVRDFGYSENVEVDPRETSLRDNIIVKDNDEPSRSSGTDIEVDDDVKRSDGMDINPVEAVIEACFDFADIIRTSEVDVRVETVTVTRDDVEIGTRDLIVVSDDGDTPPVVPEVIHEPA